MDFKHLKSISILRDGEVMPDRYGECYVCFNEYNWVIIRPVDNIEHIATPLDRICRYWYVPYCTE